MALIEIVDVSMPALDPERFWGGHIDEPKPSAQFDGHEIVIWGWVLGRVCPAVAVEVLHEDNVIRRVPLNVHRPDLATGYPAAPDAESSGFRAIVSMVGMTELELLVQAVMQDQSRVLLGTIRARRRWREEVDGSTEAALVSVVIPCYNQAYFLSEAIESVIAQTYPHFEVVVVDDGSTDNTSEVAARYPGVRCVRQENQGLAAARNTGIRHSNGSYLVFLDADDRLLPEALEVGLEELNSHPECALVYGHHRLITADGSFLADESPHDVKDDHYIALLHHNYIAMHATVMYRRSVFESVGVFDTSLRACEDYDLLLRITSNFSAYSHDEVVADYRQHSANMSRNSELMLTTSAAVVRSQWEYVKGNKKRKEAYRAGLRFQRDYYGAFLVNEVQAHLWDREWKQAMRGMLLLLRYYPRGLASVMAVPRVRGWAKGSWTHQRRIGGPAEEKEAAQREAAELRQLLAERDKQLDALGVHAHPTTDTSNESLVPPAGQVYFGNLRRVTPISRQFGYDRGQPIDRYYIEHFLARHADDVRGRVLEIGDNTYTQKFGGDRVETSDVLHVTEGNPRATIVADLTSADHIPSEAFDCIIFTQTLHLIYYVRPAIRTLHRILKPGGVLLATFPGISHLDQGQWRDTWYWTFTTLSAQRLFEETFPAPSVEVGARGNVLAAISFLQGLAAEEVLQKELNHSDPCYQVLITLRATKPEATP